MSGLRDVLDLELSRLRADIVAMAMLVEKSFSDAVEALFSRDPELADKVIRGDGDVDSYHIAIEERCMKTIATQQPVASDLRLLVFYMRSVIHLERIGDLSVNIAKMAKETSLLARNEEVFLFIRQMSALIQGMLSSLTKALSEGNKGLALKVVEMDEDVDELYSQVLVEFAKVKDEPELMRWAADIILVCRFLERIADNAVTVASRFVALFE